MRDKNQHEYTYINEFTETNKLEVPLNFMQNDDFVNKYSGQIHLDFTLISKLVLHINSP